MKHIINKNQKGQAFVTLIVFVAVATTLISAAVVVTLVNSQGTSKYALGEETLIIAESGAENALLRLLRDPNYTGETLTNVNGTATITVTGSTTKTITSEGVNGNFKRKIQVVGSFSNNIFSITSWNEVP